MSAAVNGPTPRAVLHSSETYEWYTPPAIIAAAREVLGTIDLDPASSLEANAIVQATRFFTVGYNGLARPWHAATVWLNPPYGKTGNTSNQELWSQKLYAEVWMGHVRAALLLVNAATDTTWFQSLAQRRPICLIAGRINFKEPEARRIDRFERDKKEADSPTHGNALVYFGQDEGFFSAICMRLGTPAGKWLRWPGGVE